MTKISENFLRRNFHYQNFRFSNFVEPEENILQMTSLHDSLVMTHGAQHTNLVFKSVGNPHGVRRKDFQGKRDEREIKRPQEGAILGEDKIWNDCNHVTQITRRFI